MKRYLCLAVAFGAALAIVIASAVRAEEATAASDGDKAYQKVRDAESVTPPPTLPEDEQMKWWVESYERTVKSADAFLDAYPKHEKANAVRLMKGHTLLLLRLVKNDAAYLEKAKHVLNEVFENAPTDQDGFSAYCMLATYPDTSVEEAARYLATVKEKFPDAKDLPQLDLFMISKYLEAGKIPEAKKAAQGFVDTYSKNETAMIQKLSMQAKDLLKKMEAIGTELELKFTALDGKEVDIKNYRGKVVLVDFWATWCGPCRAELPNVIKAYETYHSKGFEIIGISFDRAQDKEKLQQFLVDQKMTWPQYFDGKFWQNDIGTKFGIRGIPATFLVGKDGKIARLDLRGEALSKAVAELLSK